MQEELSQIFERSANEEFHNSSPLYELSHWLLPKTRRCFLSLPIAEKESVLQTCFLRQCTCCFLKAHGIRFLCITEVFLDPVLRRTIRIPRSGLSAWNMMKRFAA